MHSLAAERVIAAGVEQYQVDPGAGFFQLVEDAGHADHLRKDIRFVERMGVDRRQIIEAVSLDAMAGVIEQRNVGAGQLGLELLKRLIEAGLIEIQLGAAADHEKAKRQQRIRHQPGVGRRVWQHRHRAVGRIADHQCNALFGMRHRGHPGAQQNGREKQSRHDADPTRHDDAPRSGANSRCLLVSRDRQQVRCRKKG